MSEQPVEQTTSTAPAATTRTTGHRLATAAAGAGIGIVAVLGLGAGASGLAGAADDPTPDTSEAATPARG